MEAPEDRTELIRPFAGARFSLDRFVGSSGGGGPGYFDLRAVMFWLPVHV